MAKQQQPNVRVGRAFTSQQFDALVRRNSAGAQQDRRRVSRRDVRAALKRGDW